MQLALARQDVKERESSEDIADTLGWQLQPAPTLVLGVKPGRKAWVWGCVQTFDDACWFPATISIGSLLCFRAPAIRAASTEEKMAKKSKRRCDTLPVLHPDAAGIDVGASELYVAVAAEHYPQPVRRFPTFTRDLHVLADWLEQCGIRSVAMESTSVYWIPVYQILEARGLEVCLVNARHVKNVPGRKTDVSDCQWLQYLHSVGLLRASFRPPGEICAIRSLWRHRSSLIQMAAEHVLHM